MRLTLSVIGALIGAGLLALPVPAAAAPVSGAMAKSLLAQAGYDSLAGERAQVIPAQYRPRRGPYRGRPRRGGDDGAGVAAGIIGGLLLGAIIANQAQQSRSVEYCIRRYRSYDRYSGTYLGYDGLRHRCP